MNAARECPAASEPDPTSQCQTPASRASRSETPKSNANRVGVAVAHTLNACIRCRQRKSRCDTGIPRCTACARSNSQCEYYDPAKGLTISRSYVVELRDKIRRLTAELEELGDNETDQDPDPASMVRSAGLIRFKETDESRFLGPSSGITITRFVMEMAKQNTDSKSIKEVVTDSTAREIRGAFTRESQKPTSKVYPLVSSVAEPDLPPQELTHKLVDMFMAKAQYMLPTLHEPSFRRDVDDALKGSQDPRQNFQVRLVIAISMQKISTAYAGLADSYYLAALPFLDACIRRMDLSSLQCYALMAQYSLLTPTRTAAYWVVGAAAKLCQDLGLTEEATITKSTSGQPLDFLEVDMRRRLFWIITSMEYGLSHSLGRPSAFCVGHDHINVNFFQMVDDRFITRHGLLSGSQPIMKKCIAIHFFKMRLLQAEIRRTLYLRGRPAPVSDQDPWFEKMLEKMNDWVESCPKNDEGSGLSKVWFQGRLNTMIVFMYRPSPQIPEPSLEAARRCYDACAFNVKIQKEQVKTGSIDLTWIFTQSVFMALNTILWTLSYPEIRQEHSKEEVMENISLAMDVIAHSAERWPGVESAVQLYISLITGCLKAYDSHESFVVQSPSNHPGSTASSNPASPETIYDPPTSTTRASTSTLKRESPRRPALGVIYTPRPTPTRAHGEQTDPGPVAHAPQPAPPPTVHHQIYTTPNTQPPTIHREIYTASDQSHYFGNTAMSAPAAYYDGSQNLHAAGISLQTPRYQNSIHRTLDPVPAPTTTAAANASYPNTIHRTLDPVSAPTTTTANTAVDPNSRQTPRYTNTIHRTLDPVSALTTTTANASFDHNLLQTPQYTNTIHKTMDPVSAPTTTAANATSFDQFANTMHRTLDPMSAQTTTTTANAPSFDVASHYNHIPSVLPGLQHWDPNYTTASTTASNLAFPDATTNDPMFWMGSIGDQYSQFFQQPYTTPAWRNRSLSQEEHMELMAALLRDLPDMSTPMEDVRASYGGGML